MYASLLRKMCLLSEGAVRNIDPLDEMLFFRLRTKKNEIIVAPDHGYLLIVIQSVWWTYNFFSSFHFFCIFISQCFVYLLKKLIFQTNHTLSFWCLGILNSLPKKLKKDKKKQDQVKTNKENFHRKGSNASPFLNR